MNPTRRRTTLAAALTALAALNLAPTAQAQASDYPRKQPISLVVPYPAGGANDAVARLVGQKLGEQLRQQVIIDNRPGAGTTIGVAAVAKAPADGYTIVLGSLASHAVSPHLFFVAHALALSRSAARALSSASFSACAFNCGCLE